MAQAGYDHPTNERGVTKAHFCFGGVDVHINLSRRQIQEQRHHRVPVPRQHFGISPAHGPDEQPVLYGTAINEQELMVSDTAIIGRQAGHAAKADALPLKIQRHAVIDKFAAG